MIGGTCEIIYHHPPGGACGATITILGSIPKKRDASK